MKFKKYQFFCFAIVICVALMAVVQTQEFMNLRKYSFLSLVIVICFAQMAYGQSQELNGYAAVRIEYIDKAIAYIEEGGLDFGLDELPYMEQAYWPYEKRLNEDKGYKYYKYDDYSIKKVEEAYSKLRKLIDSKGGLDELLGALQKKNSEQSKSSVKKAILSEIDKLRAEVSKPQGRGMDDWLRRAVSMKERDEWANADPFILENKSEIYKKLDEVASLFRKNVPNSSPREEWFTLKEAKYTDVLKTSYKKNSNMTIYNVGLPSTNWKYDKDNYNQPKRRYVVAYIYYKDTKDIVPFCRVDECYLVQDYMGGGKYDENTRVALSKSWIYGCPK